MGGGSSKVPKVINEVKCAECKVCEVCSFSDTYLKSCTDITSKIECYKNIVDHIDDHIRNPTHPISTPLIEQILQICLVYEGIYNYARIKGVLEFLSQREQTDKGYLVKNNNTLEITKIFNKPIVNETRGIIKQQLPENINYTPLSRIDDFATNYVDFLDNKIKKEVFYKRLNIIH